MNYALNNSKPIQATRRPTASPAVAGEPGSNQLAPIFAYRIEKVPIESVKVYANNPRLHRPKQIEAIAASIRSFGLVRPLLVDRDYVLVDGHALLAAAEVVGMTEVPVITVDHLTEIEVRALRITLNRLPDLASWDEAALAVEFQALIEADLAFDLSFDVAVTGFAMPEIDRILTKAEDREPAGSPDDALPEPDLGPAVSRVGDLWLLGEHRLACGDSTVPTTFDLLLEGERAAIGIHDVPYNVRIRGNVSSSGRHGEFVMASGEMTQAEFTRFLTRAFDAIAGCSAAGSIHYAFIDWRHLTEMSMAGEAAGLELKNVCVWDKGSGAMGSFYRSQHELVYVWKLPGAPHINNVELGKHGRNRTNVWTFPGAAALREELKLHATPKPVALVMEAIRDCSHRGDLVLDAFSGSGTTIIAAARTGRRAVAVDLDPRHVDTAVRRWQRWSGEAARHAVTGFTFDETADHRACSGETVLPATALTARGETDGEPASPVTAGAVPPRIRTRRRTASV